MSRLLALLVAGLVLLPSAAIAGVEVDPSKLRPTLFIKVVKSNEHMARQAMIRRKTGTSNTLLEFGCKELDPVAPSYGCRVKKPAKPKEPAPGLTEGDILRAVRQIGLPSLQVRTQPEDATLVNIPTIFYTRPEDFRRSITLLGFDIDLVADPVRYRWSHGDGTTSSTGRPGKPYPSMDVTHLYEQPAETVKPKVDVIYRVKYRVDGGNWSTLDQTLTATGPLGELEVREAAPVLVKP